MNPLAQVDPIMVGIAAVGLIAGFAILAVIIRLVRRAIRNGAGPKFGFGVAVVIAVFVAVAGGWKSFDAVAHQFGSPLVPLVADGMVIACTALRLAAMTKGWRIPGAALTTYVFIAGSVIINTTAVDGWAAKLGYALAPLAYAVLAEMLAHLVRLKMKLTEPTLAGRLPAVKWFVSPVVTTRMWVHMKRTDATDPRQVRTLIKQVERVASRLSAVCPSTPGWLPFGRAHAARSAVLDSILEGLLTQAEAAALLPADDGRLSPGELLARLDRATVPAPVAPHADEVPAAVRPAAALALHRPASVTASAPVHPAASAAAPAAASESSAPPAPYAPDESAPAPASDSAPTDADDAALVSFLHRHAAEHNDGQPLAIREVQRAIRSGWSKAKRIHALTGWTETDPNQTKDSQPKTERQLQLLPNTSSKSEVTKSQTELQESRA